MDVSVALQSGGILLREGLEAILIVGVLVAFVVKIKASEHVKTLYAGGLAAILASCVAAYFFITRLNGVHDERLEAVVMLCAAALMFYVSGWLFLRQDPRVLKAGLERSAQRALTDNAAYSLAGVAFLAVFREGAETILFMHALALSNGGWAASGAAIVEGIAVAAVMLVALFVAMRWLVVRLPLRPLFIATSAFLFVMGLKFVGGGILELQEMAIVSYNDLPLPDALIALGLNPTWEAVGSQIVIALLAIVSTLALYLARPAPQQPAE
jgi:high-affinity iron transporter